MHGCGIGLHHFARGPPDQRRAGMHGSHTGFNSRDCSFGRHIGRVNKFERLFEGVQRLASIIIITATFFSIAGQPN